MAKGKRFIVEDEWIYGYEPFFDGYVKIASIHEKTKQIRPTHGYYPPHPYGKATKSYAIRNGYDYIAK